MVRKLDIAMNEEKEQTNIFNYLLFIANSFLHIFVTIIYHILKVKMLN